jgi:hypothetical protein
MAAFYNEGKDGSKFATIAITDWSTVNSSVEFDELRFASDDDFYYLFAQATKFTDVLKVGDKDWKFSPQLVTFSAARKTVQKWNKAEGKKVDTPQSDVERLVCFLLDKLDAEKAYGGFISLQNTNFIKTAIEGKDAQGKDVPEVVREQILGTLGSLYEVETELIPKDDIKVPAKKAWGNGGSKGQTELEKLGDRLTFIAGQLKASGIEYEVKSVYDLAPEKLAKDCPKDAEKVQLIYAFCIELMK